MRLWGIIVAVIAGLAGAFLALAGGGEAALAAASAPPGTIAFARGGDIWVMRSDGGGQRRLTATPEWESQPRWSPDGERLAFVVARSRDGKTTGISAVAADGSDRQALFSNAVLPTGRVGAIQSFAWAPDGGRIILAEYPPRSYGLTGPFIVVLVFLDGGASEVVYEAGAGSGMYAPAWAPSGRRVYFAYNSEEGAWPFSLIVPGGRLRQERALFASPFVTGIDVSADGAQVAYSCAKVDWDRGPPGPIDNHIFGSEVRVMRADGGGRRVLISSQYQTTRYSAVSWAPGGDWLCYTITHWDSWQDQTGTVWVARLDGVHDVKIADNAYESDWRPQPASDGDNDSGGSAGGGSSSESPSASPSGASASPSPTPTVTTTVIVQPDDGDGSPFTSPPAIVAYMIGGVGLGFLAVWLLLRRAGG